MLVRALQVVDGDPHVEGILGERGAKGFGVLGRESCFGSLQEFRRSHLLHERPLQQRRPAGRELSNASPTLNVGS